MLFMQSKCQRSDLNIGPIFFLKKKEKFIFAVSLSSFSWHINLIESHGRNGRFITVNKSRTQHRCEGQKESQRERHTHEE